MSTASPSIAILAAGMGTRLAATATPKPLTRLSSRGRSILDEQLSAVRAIYGPDTTPVIVVGHQAEKIRAAAPDADFIVNEDYRDTNTARSLLLALEQTDGGVLWMNGDVVFDPKILLMADILVQAGKSFTVVVHGPVDDEAMKYEVDQSGRVVHLSKQLESPQGEAVGINYIAPQDKPLLVKQLRQAGPQDFFEKALDAAINEDGLELHALYTQGLYAVEVDFPEDLYRVNELLAGQ